ncbi:hypothetical protein WDZ92_42995, partial [Nostoc sp. NIES-2111]
PLCFIARLSWMGRTARTTRSVALARALAPRPNVLLLDEALSALDAKIRISLHNEIRQIRRELGITTVFVMHDLKGSLSISDRIVVMNGGVAEQVGDPFTIYNRPATRFVATFVGTLTRSRHRSRTRQRALSRSKAFASQGLVRCSPGQGSASRSPLGRKGCNSAHRPAATLSCLHGSWTCTSSAP